MCGIAGLVMRPGERVDETLVERMTRAVAHRGPDAQGIFVDQNVAIGHRRLSIIDTREIANQPLWNADRTVGVINNGEIYNFQALREQLESRGYRFATNADTEAIVHGWTEWGEKVIERLRGMFALAIFDRRDGRLLLARDRLGKKPMHYALAEGRLAFGSEIKALLPVPWISRAHDRRAAGEYMVYGNVAGTRTIYAGIRRLDPGELMVVETRAERFVPRIERYFAPDPAADPRLDEREWLDAVDREIAEAVRLRLIADVPLGAFLSGGIDSSLVVAHMARLVPGKVKTFCIGFRETGWDESRHAQAVADHLGTEHTTEFVTADAAAMLPELVSTFDEPFADPSAIPTWYVAQMTRRHVTVALSGDGGDELFVGYKRYAESQALQRVGAALLPPGRALARSVSGGFRRGTFARRALERVAHREFDLYHHAHGWAPEFLDLLAPEVRGALGAAEEQEAYRDFNAPRDASFLRRCQMTDLGNYLPDQVLVKADRASMRHALEVRAPLLDQEVLRLALRMPPERQLSGRRQKLLLRKLAYRYVPPQLLDRPKQGFAVPLDRWLRNELAPLLERAIADERSATWSFFDRAEARRRFEEHRADAARHEKALWRLLVFHAWAEAGG
jgi:asparagine synthase (glutamine-hydrolysing)